MSAPDYVYKRKNGGTTHCYGKVEEGANFDITCRDENNDGVYTDNDHATTWRQLCIYLEKNYDPAIEQIIAV